MIVKLLENHRKLLLGGIFITQLIHQSLQSSMVLLLVRLRVVALAWLHVLIHQGSLRLI